MVGLVAGLALGSQAGREILQAALKGGLTIALVKTPGPCKHPFVEVHKSRRVFCVHCHALVKLPKGHVISKKRKH